MKQNKGQATKPISLVIVDKQHSINTLQVDSSPDNLQQSLKKISINENNAHLNSIKTRSIQID